MNDSSLPTPEAAEAAFYAAFDAMDAEAMMTVWAPEAVVCIHPLGPRLDDRERIAESWRQIFAAGERMRVTPRSTVLARTEELSVHCVTEVIDHGPTLAEQAVVVATNAYRRTEHGWRMVLHHGSPGTGPRRRAPGPEAGRMH
ncbi:MAG: nuclear transport factor 2 family protein [Chromatiales bacterium]|nr:nuclear transport factor 2 family protein [Chromatiales bacterium]